MQPINKQSCHFCVAGEMMFRSQGIVKLPILTIDTNTNNVLDTIELFCKGEAAATLKSLNFKKGDYGYCEGGVTFSKDKPSDIAPTVLEKLPSGTMKFRNLNYDETNDVLYTFIWDKRIDFDDRGNKVFNSDKKIEKTTQSERNIDFLQHNNYQKKPESRLKNSKLQSQLKSLLSEDQETM